MTGPFVPYFGPLVAVHRPERAEGGAEKWRRQLDFIIKAYRGVSIPIVGHIGGAPPAPPITIGLPLDEAVREMRKLGLSEGEALYYLRSRSR